MNDITLSFLTIIISVIISSSVSLILFVLEPIKEKRNYVFEEKKRVYEAIIVFC